MVSQMKWERVGKVHRLEHGGRVYEIYANADKTAHGGSISEEGRVLVAFDMGQFDTRQELREHMEAQALKHTPPKKEAADAD